MPALAMPALAMPSASPSFNVCPLLEGVVTTLSSDGNEQGATHVAAMGPRVDLPGRRLLLRPFQSSTTYQNLCRVGRGIFHLTDDVLLIARAAIGRLPADTPLVDGPEGFESSEGYGQRLGDCVRWYAFEVVSRDDSQERAELVCQIVESGNVRDFIGLHRARHAVVEGAILATRLDLLPLEKVLDDFTRLGEIIDKTASPTERLAFSELQQFVAERLGEAETASFLDPGSP